MTAPPSPSAPLHAVLTPDRTAAPRVGKETPLVTLGCRLRVQAGAEPRPSAASHREAGPRGGNDNLTSLRCFERAQTGFCSVATSLLSSITTGSISRVLIAGQRLSSPPAEHRGDVTTHFWDGEVTREVTQRSGTVSPVPSARPRGSRPSAPRRAATAGLEVRSRSRPDLGSPGVRRTQPGPLCHCVEGTPTDPAGPGTGEK